MWLAISLTLLGCNRDPVDRLVAQLQGGSCVHHTEPLASQLDDSCKRGGPGTIGMRWIAGPEQCALWAAECLEQLGPEAADAVDPLIEALATGPNNLDTGDGVIPARDAIARALGATRDLRAVDALLEALRSPRPVDAAPGAVGHASPDPIGEVAALEGLGLVGPAAARAVPEVLAQLGLPIASDRDARRHRAAAEALAAIADPRGIDALIGELDDPQRREAAARALEGLGSGHEAVVSALVAAVTDAPDGPGNAQLRSAIRTLAGREALRDLPPNYDQRLSSLTRELTDAARAKGCVAGRVEIDSSAELFAQVFGNRDRLQIRFARGPWVAERRFSGAIAWSRDLRLVREVRFDSAAGFAQETEVLFEGICP